MKKILVLALLVVVFAPFQNAKAADPGVIQMKLGHFAADSHPGNLASKMFAEAVEKRTNGKIKVTIYPNNALGSPPEVLEQNILGAVDMSLPTQGELGKYSKKFNCVMLPDPVETRRTRERGPGTEARTDEQQALGAPGSGARGGADEIVDERAIELESRHVSRAVSDPVPIETEGIGADRCQLATELGEEAVATGRPEVSTSWQDDGPQPSGGWVR